MRLSATADVQPGVNLAAFDITLDGQRYQGIVALSGGCLAHTLDAYFEQSEQLKSRFWLAADSDRAAGMLIQQLPAQVTPDAGAQTRVTLQQPPEQVSNTVHLGDGPAAASAVVDLLDELGVL